MRVGTAFADITPNEPLPLLGQMHERIAHAAHDPITANAVAFDDGTSRAVLVSCDLLWLEDAFVREVQADCAARTGVDAGAVLLACTHTHLGPATSEFGATRACAGFLDRLRAVLADLVEAAIRDLAEATVFAGRGWLEYMGFNRRGLRTDGRGAMYHGSWNADFAGIEGPRDGEVGVLFARRTDGSVKAVVPSFSTHPNTLEGETFYGADVPGAVRGVLRAVFGEALTVVYLTGAAGNTAPSVMEDNADNMQPWRGEEGWRRSGWYLGAEILKVVAATVRPMADAAVRLAGAVLPIAVRPWPPGFPPPDWAPGPWRDYYLHCREQWPERVRQANPVPVHLNVLRIGDAAVCTNPAELYVEHGLAIKAASPARVTLISELTDGYVGYVPTRAAFGHGGYSTWPAPSSQLAEDAGDRMVAETLRLLGEAFGGAGQPPGR